MTSFITSGLKASYQGFFFSSLPILESNQEGSSGLLIQVDGKINPAGCDVKCLGHVRSGRKKLGEDNSAGHAPIRESTINTII